MTVGQVFFEMLQVDVTHSGRVRQGQLPEVEAATDPVARGVSWGYGEGIARESNGRTRF